MESEKLLVQSLKSSHTTVFAIFLGDNVVFHFFMPEMFDAFWHGTKIITILLPILFIFQHEKFYDQH